MTRRSIPVAALCLTAISLACWILMFLAGTDIWHDTGRLDLRTLGAHGADVRALAVAFYGLLPVLLVQFVVSVVGLVRASRVA